MFHRLKHFDAYPKPLEDFRVRTTSGALLTFVCTLLIILLFFFEWSTYMTVDVEQELFVDLTRNQKLTINLNMTFPHLHCYLMSLDVLDASGDNRNDVVKGLKKIRIDKDGQLINPVANIDRSAASASALDNPNATNATSGNATCLSCYGAESAQIPCCNTCADVRMAYKKKNWQLNSLGVEQCKDDLEESEKSMRASINSKDSPEYIASLIDSQEGCQLAGHLEVNKVAGHFHIAPGISFENSHMHVHDVKNMPLNRFNTRHFFETFSFGDEYPNQNNVLEVRSQARESTDGSIVDMVETNMLNGVPVQSDCISYSYFLKIVPTTYEYIDGRIVNNTYQYSVTKSAKVFDANNMMMNSRLPGIFVSYELSPIMVKFIEKSKPFIHFITGCCAIIGGLFTVAGMIDGLIFKYIKMYQKYQISKIN